MTSVLITIKGTVQCKRSVVSRIPTICKDNITRILYANGDVVPLLEGPMKFSVKFHSNLT